MIVPDPLLAKLERGCQQLGLRLSAAQLAQLISYLQLMMKWNKAFNLSAIRDASEAVDKHLLDSLSLVSQMEPGKRYLDIGAGAGLPGIPLAIACPDIVVTMVDGNGKKTRFIQQAIAELGLTNANVIHSRIEQLPMLEFDVVMARALGTLAQMLDWLGERLDHGRQMLAMKGIYPEQELSELPSRYKVDAITAIDVPGIDAQRHVVWLSVGAEQGEECV